MYEDRFTFNRGAVRPIECLSGAWQLIKRDYWLLLGITFVGYLISAFAPFGILMGPAMCGVYVCLLRQMDGRRVSFDMLFEGFNYFGQSLIATMIMMIPLFLAAAVYLVGYFGGLITFAAMMGQQQQAGEPPNPMAPLFFVGGLLVWTVAFIVVTSLAQLFFFFIYPLIVDRELTGVEAVRVSFRAVWANFLGVFAIVFLEIVVGIIVGLFTCDIGLIFLVPIPYATAAVAYRQVFPSLDDPYADMPLDPEPPAPLVLEDATAIQAKSPPITSVTSEPEA